MHFSKQNRKPASSPPGEKTISMYHGSVLLSPASPLKLYFPAPGASSLRLHTETAAETEMHVVVFPLANLVGFTTCDRKFTKFLQ